MMKFIQEHHLMANGVQSVSNSPLLISTQFRYSAVAVEVNNDIGIAMLYIGEFLLFCT